MSTSAERAESFIRFLLDCGALRFGDFVTKSGRASPYFINMGTVSSGPQIERLGELYADELRETFGGQVTNLFGPAYKGIPLVVTTAAALHRQHGDDVSFTYNRKEKKDHGEGGSLVGEDYSSDAGAMHKVVVLEDVTTAGTSIRETLPTLRLHPRVEVIGMLVGVDRGERGRGKRAASAELATDFGLTYRSLATVRDLLSYIEKTQGTADEVANAEQLSRMQRYIDEFCPA